jgi:hypothetical protein
MNRRHGFGVRCVGSFCLAASARMLLAAAVSAIAISLAFASGARAAGTWRGPFSVDRHGQKVLLSVACPAANQCTGVDNSGQEVTFNPHSPGTPKPVTVYLDPVHGRTLYAVSCPSVTQCTAVGDGAS